MPFGTVQAAITVSRAGFQYNEPPQSGCPDHLFFPREPFRAMTSAKASTPNFQADLEKLFGLKSVSYKYELSKEELFHEAIAHDRGRVRRDGGSNEQKGYPTKLGVN